MTYELWDQASGNRVEGFGQFSTLAEIVRQIAELQGTSAVDDLFVEVWATPDAEEPVQILRGDLLKRFVQPLVATYAADLTDGYGARTSTSQSTLVLAV
jgi:hypothetical protein